MASSSNGEKLIAGQVSYGGIYVSTSGLRRLNSSSRSTKIVIVVEVVVKVKVVITKTPPSSHYYHYQ